jgi:molybdopterin-guanine dinucleotide biosynthesis protein A
MARWDAVLLAGGAGRRLGTIDKPALSVRGRTLLDIAIAACAAARMTVVVGPVRPTSRPVRWAREDPPGGGPLAALATGVRALDPGTDFVVVLAADLPAVTAAAVRELVAAAGRPPAPDGAVARDASGRRQPLLAAYRRTALERALDTLGDPHDRAFRELTDRLVLESVDVAAAAADIDTPDDLRRWQRGEL